MPRDVRFIYDMRNFRQFRLLQKNPENPARADAKKIHNIYYRTLLNNALLGFSVLLAYPVIGVIPRLRQSFHGTP